MGNWDNDIDEVARQMTEGGPGASFNAHVLARVDTVNPRRWRQRSVWTWSAVAVAATAVLAFVIVRPTWRAETVRVKPDTADTIRPGPDNANAKYAAASGAVTDAARQGETVESYRADASSVAAPGTSRATAPTTPQVPSYVVSGPARTGAATLDPQDQVMKAVDAIADADRIDALATSTGFDPLIPEPIHIEPIGIETMESTESLETPALAIAWLEVPPMGEQ